jgi:acetyl esterase/lipase
MTSVFAPLSATLIVGLALAQACATAPAPSTTTTPPTAGTSAAQGAPARPFVSRVQPSFPLWSNGAPGALGTDSTDQPNITPYLPPAGTANGTAVVVYPGGGYTHLAMDHEGRQIANWLASNGVAAFVVRYRLGPRYHHPTMLGDAQRAIRTVRSRATEWGVDATRIGIIGFSAGGHLASTAGTHFDALSSSGADAIDRASSRPDFMMLIYPVITMRDSVTHRGSHDNVLGPNADPALVRLLANELQVTRATPPAFIVHSTDDRTVPVENAVLMYRALRDSAVPVEMHIFEHGGHGYGMAPKDPILSVWPSLAEGWMRRHGWLGAAR